MDQGEEPVKEKALSRRERADASRKVLREHGLAYARSIESQSEPFDTVCVPRLPVSRVKNILKEQVEAHAIWMNTPAPTVGQGVARILSGLAHLMASSLSALSWHQVLQTNGGVPPCHGFNLKLEPMLHAVQDLEEFDFLIDIVQAVQDRAHRERREAEARKSRDQWQNKMLHRPRGYQPPPSLATPYPRVPQPSHPLPPAGGGAVYFATEPTDNRYRAGLPVQEGKGLSLKRKASWMA